MSKSLIRETSVMNKKFQLISSIVQSHEEQLKGAKNKSVAKHKKVERLSVEVNHKFLNIAHNF